MTKAAICDIIAAAEEIGRQLEEKLVQDLLQKLTEAELRILALEMAKFAAGWCPDRQLDAEALAAEAYYALTGREQED